MSKCFLHHCHLKSLHNGATNLNKTSLINKINEWNPRSLLILQFSNPGAGTIALDKEYLILN